MSTILCLSLAGVIVSVWPHTQFDLVSTSADTKQALTERWQIDAPRDRLRLLPNAGFERGTVRIHAASDGRAGWGVAERVGHAQGHPSTDRLRLARPTDGNARWTLCSGGRCSPVETLVAESLERSGLLDDRPIELHPCQQSAR